MARDRKLSLLFWGDSATASRGTHNNKGPCCNCYTRISSSCLWGWQGRDLHQILFFIRSLFTEDYVFWDTRGSKSCTSFFLFSFFLFYYTLASRDPSSLIPLFDTSFVRTTFLYIVLLRKTYGVLCRLYVSNGGFFFSLFFFRFYYFYFFIWRTPPYE